MRFYALVFILLIYRSTYAQEHVLHAASPSWVIDYEYNDGATDSSGTSNGYRYLLISIQNHLETKEYYRKYAIKVISEQGLSAASSINEAFDPSHQRLTFHTLNIIRNGKTINKMDARKFDVIRREDQMDRAVYDKTLNAVYNLPDVRVGDVVEYSFTIKGSNPVFAGHSFGSFYLQYGVPVKKFAHRLLFQASRPLQFKAFGEVPSVRETHYGKMKHLEWIKENVPALLMDDMVPSWFDPYGRVEYTDYRSWDEVKEWAIKVFDLKKPQGASLVELVNQVRHLEGDLEGKIKECIRIVQGDIRYLSFSDGIHSYKPHAPDQVYEQKYGDCKDKSLLLSHLLTQIGVQSFPALVSTESGESMDEILPTPWAFNHCIVNFTLNDSTFWIDPTLNTQVGPLKEYTIPSYKRALVVGNAGQGLARMNEQPNQTRIDVLEEYFIDQVGGYVSFKVKSEYAGYAADDMRAYVHSNTKEEIHKNYLNFYAKDYSDISLSEDVDFRDNTEENVITSNESYLVKNFWTVAKDKTTNASVYARVLASYLHRPDTRLRTMPLSMAHPRRVTQTIKIYLPESWDVDDDSRKIESDGFVYRSSVLYGNNTITLRYSYETKSASLPVEAATEHIDKIDDVFDDLTFNIYKTSEEEEGRSTEFLVMVLMICVGIYFMRKRFK